MDDYVGADNPVRFIDAFVDRLDLAAAGFIRVEPKVTGRPGYAPGDLLKLYIYGYLNRVRSSRRLEAETHRNIEVIWLLRHLKPDFKTIADFRRDNRTAFRQVFRHFVLLCRQLDLFGRELLAVDGTRIKAVNNKDRNFTRASLRKFIKAADAKLDDYLQRLDQSEPPRAQRRLAGHNLAEKITEKFASGLSQAASVISAVGQVRKSSTWLPFNAAFILHATGSSAGSSAGRWRGTPHTLRQIFARECPSCRDRSRPWSRRNPAVWPLGLAGIDRAKRIDLCRPRCVLERQDRADQKG